MLNAEETSEVREPLAGGPGNGNGTLTGLGPFALNRSNPPLHAVGLERPPGPPTWEGLPPGPKVPYPIQMIAFLYRRRPWLARCRAKYGSPFTIPFRVPPVPGVVVSKPDQLKQMFLAPPDVLWAADGSSDLHKYFGSPGLAYMEEEEHLTRRKLINKSVHGEAMRKLATSMEAVVEREIASWPRDELVELFPKFRRVSVSVMRYANFGADQDPRLDRLVDMIEQDLYATANTPIALVEDHYLGPRERRVLNALPPWKRIVEVRARVDELMYELIDERRRAGGGDGTDTLSVLLQTRNEDGTPLSSVEIRNDLMTNFLAGSATTASAMSWAVSFLSRQPDTRRRLVEEIDAGEDDAYLTATMQEVLRRKPPLPAPIPRLVRKPFEIGGYVLPPGVRLVASGSLLHHDPEIYPDPYRFKPERFLDNPPGNFTWIPFGGGRRKCLGKPIAEQEIKIALRVFFRMYEPKPDMPEPERDATLLAAIRPSRSCRVVLSARS
jgi:cytochrome P450